MFFFELTYTKVMRFIDPDRIQITGISTIITDLGNVVANTLINSVNSN
jgi:hypothetical protein